MVGQREKRFLLPGDPGWHTNLGNEDVAERGYEDLPRRTLTVKCPSPACGLDLTVPSNLVAKRCTCPACGETIYPGSNGIPASAVPVIDQPNLPSARHRVVETSAQIEPHEGSLNSLETLTTVRTGCIGRGNAGKTALFRAFSDGTIGDFLPSGLVVDAGDPREVAQMIRESEQTHRLLHESGLPPTRVATPVRYYLYEGAEQRVAYHLQEVIGQVLTHTLPDSATDQQAHYNAYLANLVNTHVLWAVVPCPSSSPGARERRRFSNDLRITLAFLREAIRLRSLEQPVSVVLVLSKIDTLFSTAEEAHNALSDEKLKQVLGPLVDLIGASERVSEAAIIPVSAFGFRNGMMIEGAAPRAGMPPDAEDEPFGTEFTWILRDGVDAAPFNLDSLFLWSLLYGLRGQEDTGAIERDRQSRRLSDKLQSDLESANPWIVSLK